MLTWDPAATATFWLVAEYVPRLLDTDRRRFPATLADQIQALGADRAETVAVPHDCTDGFLGAHWRAPERYLAPQSALSTVRKGSAHLDVETRLLLDGGRRQAMRLAAEKPVAGSDLDPERVLLDQRVGIEPVEREARAGQQMRLAVGASPDVPATQDGLRAEVRALSVDLREGVDEEGAVDAAAIDPGDVEPRLVGGSRRGLRRVRAVGTSEPRPYV